MRRGSGSGAVRSACKTSWNKCIATAGVVSNTTSGGAQSFMPRKRLERVTSGTRIPRITQEGLQPQPESTPGAFGPPPHPMAQSSNGRHRICTRTRGGVFTYRRHIRCRNERIPRQGLPPCPRTWPLDWGGHAERSVSAIAASERLRCSDLGLRKTACPHIKYGLSFEMSKRELGQLS